MRLEGESSVSAQETVECGTEVVRKEDDTVGGKIIEDPWAGGDSEESVQFWGAVPDKPGETLDWGAGGEEEAREFWGMGENYKEDTCRVKTGDTVLPVVAQNDVMLRTPENDDVRLRAVQNGDVTLRAAQSDDVTLNTAESDDVRLRTSQNDDVTLRTAQSDDVTPGTSQIDGVTLNTTLTDAKCDTQNVTNLKEPINNSICDQLTGASLVPSDDLIEVQKSPDVDSRSVDADRDGEWFVVPDSWDSDQDVVTATAQLPWQPVVKRDPFKLRECLQLSLVEVGKEWGACAIKIITTTNNDRFCGTYKVA